MSFDCGKVILIALLLTGCGESVSERSANQKRDYAIDEAFKKVNRDYANDQQQAAEHRLRSLEERVTALENK